MINADSPALRELLLALADDEFVIGFCNSEWTGIAPVLEEDIAFSSLAQDELGHARLLYELLAELEGRSADAIAYGRAPGEFRHAQLAERERGDWAYSVMRQYLYDTADYLRLGSLQRSAYAPLANAAARIIREEKYHLLHANTWLERLAQGTPEAHRRQGEALHALWPDALGVWEPTMGEEDLLASGVLPERSAALCQRWVASLAAPFERLGLPFPFARHGDTWEPEVAPCYGGRQGRHEASFTRLHDTITSVYRLDPTASW